MQRRVAIAGWRMLLVLLSAQAGCGWGALRRHVGQEIQTREQAARTQQTVEHAQEAIERGAYPEARLELVQLVAQAPQSAEARQRLGKVFQLEGRLPEAAACFRAALQRDPDYVDALIGLGQVEAEQGDVACGLKRLETAIEIDPHRAAGHYSLGSLFESLGRVDDALAEYFRAIETEPNDADSNLRIAAIQLARNQPDQALSRLDQVLELAAENGAAYDLRGRAHMKLRQFTQAIEDFRAAASRLPDRPDIPYQLALALEAAHQPVDALHAAEQALRLAPTSADAQALSQRLALAVAHAGKTKGSPGAREGVRSDREPPAEPAK
jgi:tetratricopeptide (TPR) repeat protein